MRQISAEEVYAALPIGECIDVVAKAMVAVSRGQAVLPLRSLMPLGSGNAMGIMPGGLSSPAVHGIKLVSLYPRNPERGLSSHQGVILLFDTETGRPIAAVDGASVTAQRTAAASAAATRALARKDARVLAILGAGEQAEHHLPAHLAVRAFEEVRVWTRTFAKAQAFAARHAHSVLSIRAVASAQEAVAGADVVVTVTASPTAILRGEWLQPGQHVNLVGASVASAREIDDAGVARGRFFVDTLAGAKAQAGEYIDALNAGVVTEGHILGEIGRVYDRSLAGRLRDDDVTIYKSLGVAAQDLAVAYEILSRLP
ncbi:ornithine cyclodeaminase [Mesorhizobium sp. L-8-10]|uniref:ornithine cyclodeaminase family protein n=1 Tax=Mesorhizobium sp. L-8-10 TaxID=2744523 RepID=UPI001926DC6F|nr:ornithine cyclodeaminase family protein [Mesorhizobium sp. L-8-10]BCH29059.1 ornithine cyclodeaminase [Mesorhizobium sp. L-8-10]